VAHELCGGPSIESTLKSSKDADLKRLASSGFFALSSENVKKALTCADAVKGALTDRTVVRIAFEDGDKHRTVAFVRAHLDELPSAAGFTRNTFSGLAGGCVKPTTGDCPDDAHAAAHEGDAWFFGTVEDVRAFARSYASPQAELTSQVEALARLAAGLKRVETVDLQVKPDVIPWARLCAKGAPSEGMADFLKVCMPPDAPKSFDAILAKTRGVAWESSHLSYGDAYHEDVVLVARDEDGAKGLERDVADLARDWRSQVANAEAAMDKAIRAEKDPVENAYDRAMFDPFLRAMKTMSVARSGDIVRVSVHTPLKSAEAKALREATARATDDQVSIGRIADSLALGQAPARADLLPFVPAGVIDWSTLPKLTTDDCKRLREHAEQVEAAGPERFAARFADGQRFKDAACVGRGLSEAAKKCLAGATTVEAHAACEHPTSLGTFVAHQKVRGQWETEEKGKRVVVEIGTSQVAIAVGDDPPTVLGPLVLDSEDGVACTLETSGPAAAARALLTVDVVDADNVKISLSKGSKVPFKRTKLANALLPGISK